MITPATFRIDLPEFASAQVYPDSAITYWISIAGLLLISSRWGQGSATASSPPTTVLDFGTEMFVAHNLVLEKQAQDAAAQGAAPGVNTGPVSASSVGSVSQSYDTGSGLELNAGNWNLTTYGTRFVRLARQIAMGPVQVSGPSCAPPFSGGAWPGPWPWPEQGDTGF